MTDVLKLRVGKKATQGLPSRLGRRQTSEQENRRCFCHAAWQRDVSTFHLQLKHDAYSFFISSNCCEPYFVTGILNITQYAL